MFWMCGTLFLKGVDIMTLKETIFRRKSVRSFQDRAVEGETLEKIREFISSIKPLYPQIPIGAEIVGRNELRTIFPWITPDVVAVFSQEGEGMFENVGFMFQQLDLFLQSIGLGCCWLGIGTVAKNAPVRAKFPQMKYVIMLAFGYPKGNALREGAEDFRRRSLSQIADRPDPRLEVARLAPSSVNSQPWYFVHQGEDIHTYCAISGTLRKRPNRMNLIDAGIALAHIFVANPDTFEFFKTENPPQKDGYKYVGSFRI